MRDLLMLDHNVCEELCRVEKLQPWLSDCRFPDRYSSILTLQQNFLNPDRLLKSSKNVAYNAVVIYPKFLYWFLKQLNCFSFDNCYLVLKTQSCVVGHFLRYENYIVSIIWGEYLFLFWKDGTWLPVNMFAVMGPVWYLEASL